MSEALINSDLDFDIDINRKDGGVTPEAELNQSFEGDLVNDLFPGMEVSQEISIYDIDWEKLREDHNEKKPKVYVQRDLEWDGAQKNYKDLIPFASKILDHSRIYEDALSRLTWPTFEENRELFPIVSDIQKELFRLSETEAAVSEYLKILEKTVLPLFEIYCEDRDVDTYNQDADSLTYPTEIRQYVLANVVVPTLELIESSNIRVDQMPGVLSVLSNIASSTGIERDIQKQVFSAQITNTMLKIGGSEAVDYISKVYDSYYTSWWVITPEKDYPNSGPSYFTNQRSWDNPLYTLHSSIIDQLSMLKDSREIVVETMSNLIGKGSTGSISFYVKTLEKIGPDLGLGMLLSKLDSESPIERAISAEILFRLELGKIGVSEKGAKYLGKIYDLGKYNDPDFFVRRLNNSGLMAVLAQEGSIEGVFPLDLYAKGDVIQAEVRQLMSQELFLPRADETPQQRQQREQYLQLFLENYESIFNDDFFEDTSVRLNSLDLHEQGWFLLHYLELSKKEDQVSLVKLKNFVKEYGEYGLKSFLALEYGGSGEDIISFSEDNNISKEQKTNLFKNFYSIANQAMNWRKIFEKVESNLEYKFSVEAYEALIRKNAEFFKAAQIISKSPDNERLMLELFSNMGSVARSLRSLESFYNSVSGLKIVGKPTIHDEYGEDGELIKGVRHSWVFDSTTTGDRVAVSVRSRNTIEKNGVKGGGPRINFKISNPKTNVSTRIGFDLSYYNVLMGNSDTPSVSLDLGVLDPRFGEVNYSTESVGRVLSLVKDSEGGHNERSFKPEAAEHFEDIANSFVEYINKNLSI